VPRGFLAHGRRAFALEASMFWIEYRQSTALIFSAAKLICKACLSRLGMERSLNRHGEPEVVFFTPGSMPWKERNCGLGRSVKRYLAEP